MFQKKKWERLERKKNIMFIKKKKLGWKKKSWGEKKHCGQKNTDKDNINI